MMTAGSLTKRSSHCKSSCRDQHLSVAVVKLLSAVRLPACHSAVVPVQVKGVKSPVLIEQCETLNDFFIY